MARDKPHPLFAALREHCRLKPQVSEDRFLGDVVFRVGGHVFALMGRRARPAVTVRPMSGNFERLLLLPNVKRARYIGRFGWLTVTVGGEESLRLALNLVDESYSLAAVWSRRRG